MSTKDKKGLKAYYEMENDSKLHPRHRLAIKIFNLIQNGDGYRPGIRNSVFGKELQGVATTLGIGLFSVSDVNSAFVIKRPIRVADEIVMKNVEIPAILVAGNTILIGPPGGGKTRMANTLASQCGMSFNKVQMTADLTPRDITVRTVSVPTETGIKVELRFGPSFANILLLDEINRATPKTQAASLERMTSGTITYDDEKGNEKIEVLSEPCFTIATENSIELGGEGTYPLPEAQLDRFMFGAEFPLSSEETMMDVLDFVPGLRHLKVEPLTSAEEILRCRDFIMDEIEVPEKIKKYIIRLMMACRNPFDYGLFPEFGREELIKLPPNSRAALHTMHAAKTLACIGGQRVVDYDHVKKRFYELVNHRFTLNDQAFGRLQKYGGTRQFIKLLIKGDAKRDIKGILDLVPIEEPIFL